MTPKKDVEEKPTKKEVSTKSSTKSTKSRTRKTGSTKSKSTKKSVAKKKTASKKPSVTNNKVIQMPARKSTKKSKPASFKDMRALTNAAIKRFEEIYAKITKRIDHANGVIADIRKMASEQGYDPDKLSFITKEVTQLEALKVKMDRYMTSIREANMDINQKAEILELFTNIEDITDTIANED